MPTHTRLIMLSALVLSAACAKSEPRAPKKPVAVEKPAPVETPQVAPVEATQEVSADAALLKESLLGLNKKKPEVVEEAPQPRRRSRRRRVYVKADADLPEMEEDVSGLSDADFQSAIGGWSGIKNCLAQNTRGESLSGALQIKFEIGQSGSVRRSKVYGTSNESAKAIAPCVERRARRVRFPAFAGVTNVTKTAKFVF